MSRIAFLNFISAIIFFSAGNFSIPQSCDDCSVPVILLFDSSVLEPMPADPDSIITWGYTYLPSLAARRYLLNNESANNCLVLKDQGILEDTLYFGFLEPHILPSEFIESADYVIWSTVSRTGENYFFSLFLETARFINGERELIASESNFFSLTVESAFAAGEKTAAQLMPLLNRIREWEKEKRDNDPALALLDHFVPDEIKINPEKFRVDTSETINVEFTLIDCDGVPLAGRTLYFHDVFVTLNGREYRLPGTKGGIVTPDSASTNEAGKVVVQFKATYLPGTAFITAWYPHYTPSGRVHAFMGNAVIEITTPPASYWLLDASVSQTVKTHYDTVISSEYVSWVHKYSGWTEYKGSSRIRAVIENADADPENNFTFSTDYTQPHAVSVTGSCSFRSYEKEEEVIDGRLYYFTSGGENSSGFAQDCNYIQIDYTPEVKGFGLGVELSGAGSNSGRTFSSGSWGGYNDIYDDVLFGIDAGGSTDEGNCTFIKDNSGYSISGSYDLHSEGWTFKGTEYTSEEYSFSAKLVPYNLYTNLEDEVYDELFPSEYSMEQNYPNPFNPSTNINIRVKEKELVTLKIYNLLGMEVSELVNDYIIKGTHTITWNASGFPSGIYFCQMKAGDFVQTRKMMLLK